MKLITLERTWRVLPSNAQFCTNTLAAALDLDIAAPTRQTAGCLVAAAVAAVSDLATTPTSPLLEGSQFGLCYLTPARPAPPAAAAAPA
jgi:hypothetical protein